MRAWQRATVPKNSRAGIPSTMARQQRQLVEHVEAGSETLATYMLESLRSWLDDEAATRYNLDVMRAAMPSISTPATPDEVEHTPRLRELAWYHDLGGTHLPRAHAAEPWFWVIAHTKWIADGSFGSPDDQMTAWCKNSESDDTCARNFFRRVCGLPTISGGASVLTETRVSRAWWRVEIARTALASIVKDPSVCVNGCPSDADVHQMVGHKRFWAELARRAVDKVTALGEPKAIAALVVASFNTGHSHTNPPAKQALTESIFDLGRFARTRNLHVTPLKELVEVCSRALREQTA